MKYDQAIILKPDYAEAWCNKGAVLNSLKRHQEALDHYARAVVLEPTAAEIYFNQAISLAELNRPKEALAQYDHAIRLKPDYPEALCNKGAILSSLNLSHDALFHYDLAMKYAPEDAKLLSNKGLALSNLMLFDQALVQYEKSLRIDPEADWVFGDFFNVKQKVADWVDFELGLQKIITQLKENQKIINPFALLPLIDDPALHKLCSEIFSKARYLPQKQLDSIVEPYQNRKIRIAYFSGDFRDHPVGAITPGLFELHNRKDFELFAFSLKKAPENDSIRSRLKPLFDHFIEVDEKS
ncbi:tetratricopeptide repeat protein, partial [Polynucleobacter paneuropaeus]|nr:tetratricopeptide repeat protein [Polynucleobacter paneuropaeus]MBT8583011.1 tetratricopeptide repeat protein [Polynucleobacter paneuropaeus]